MASTDAQQEFEDLMRSKEHRDKHPEDDGNSNGDREDDEDAGRRSETQAMPPPNVTTARDIVPRTRYGANTGPKGVISDAQDFQESRRIYRTARSSTTIARTEEELKLGQQLDIERLAEVEEQGNLGDDSSELDDEFMTQWRQQRLQALRNGSHSNATHDRSRNRRLYGSLDAVGGEGFLEAIEKSGPTTIVVVYICDDASEISQLFEGCLKTLAIQHQETRFIKLDYEEAEIQAAGVPGIIAYRGGDKFAALIPVLDEMPDDGDLDAVTLEKVLQRGNKY